MLFTFTEFKEIVVGFNDLKHFLIRGRSEIECARSMHFTKKFLEECDGDYVFKVIYFNCDSELMMIDTNSYKEMVSMGYLE